jgi:intron-binding protein aquarius
MAKQLGVAEGQVYTCETAAYFWLLHVLSRWEKFSADAAAQRTPTCVQQLFPFKARASFRLHWRCEGRVQASVA